MKEQVTITLRRGSMVYEQTIQGPCTPEKLEDAFDELLYRAATVERQLRAGITDLTPDPCACH